jgi:hypothetical protein
MPCGSQDLPKYEPSHEFQTRKRRQVRLRCRLTLPSCVQQSQHVEMRSHSFQLEVNLNQVFKPSTTLKPAGEGPLPSSFLLVLLKYLCNSKQIRRREI